MYCSSNRCPPSSQAVVSGQVANPSAAVRTILAPPVKIVETADAIELLAEVPGADETTTEVTVEEDLLTLIAKVPADGFPAGKLVFADHRDGDYRRTFRLSDEIDRSRIEATVKHGILRVRLPKAPHAQTQKITVLAG